VQPRRQRKYLANAPLHIKHKFISVHVDKKLREKLKTRSLPVRKGDEVKVMRGKRKGTKSKVSAVSLSKQFVYLEAQTRDNAKGTKSLIPFAPSNLLLVSMAEDKRRNRQGKKIVKKKVEKKVEKKEEKPVKAEKAKKEENLVKKEKEPEKADIKKESNAPKKEGKK